MSIISNYKAKWKQLCWWIEIYFLFFSAFLEKSTFHASQSRTRQWQIDYLPSSNIYYERILNIYLFMKNIIIMVLNRPTCGMIFYFRFFFCQFFILTPSVPYSPPALLFAIVPLCCLSFVFSLVLVFASVVALFLIHRWHQFRCVGFFFNFHFVLSFEIINYITRRD